MQQPSGVPTIFHYQLCRDHASDKAADAVLLHMQGCRTAVKDLGGGKFAAASTCVVGGITILSNGITTYPDKKTVHTDTEGKYTPAYNGKTSQTLSQDQHYVGACPRGMKPGDTLQPDGTIRHTQ